MALKKAFLCLVSLIAAGSLFLYHVPAFAGLVDALDEISKEIGGEGSKDTSSSSAPSEQPASPVPAPGPAAPPPPQEFYPGATPVYTTTDPLVGDSRGLVQMPDGSMKFVEKDWNGNVVSEVPVDPRDREKFKPTEPGGTMDLDRLPDGTWEARQYDQDGNLVSVEPLSGQERTEAIKEEAPSRPAERQRELPSASSYDPATGITTTSQGNPDGSRTVTKTNADGNVLSRETIPPRGQDLPSASAYDPKTGVMTTAQGKPDGSRTVTRTKEGAPDSASAPPADGSRQLERASRATPAGAPARAASEASGDASTPQQAEAPSQPTDGVAVSSETVPESPGSAEPPAESVLNEIEKPQLPRTPGQVGRDVREAAREGLVDANPEDWERQAAAGLDAALVAGSPEEAATIAERNRQFQDGMTASDRTVAEQSEEARRLQDTRVAAEERERQDRVSRIDRESLERMRENARQDMERMERVTNSRAQAEGRKLWTPEEEAEYDRRSARYNELMQPTAAENEEISRHQATYDRVNSELRNWVATRGRAQPEDVADRAQDYATADAATKTWRDFTATGQAVNIVGEDIYHQRELGIRAQDEINAAEIYLRRKNLTAEERRAGQMFLERAMGKRRSAAEAIVADSGVVITGVAFDVGSMGVGGTVSRAASRVFGRAAPVAGRATTGGTAGTIARETMESAAPTVTQEASGATTRIMATPAADEAAQATTRIMSREAAQAASQAGRVGAPTAEQIASAERNLASLEQIAREPLETAGGQSASHATTIIEPPPAAPKPAPPAPRPDRAAAALDETGALTPSQAAEEAIRHGAPASRKEIRQLFNKIMNENTEVMMNDLQREARRLKVPESQIARAMSDSAAAPREMSHLIAEASGFRVLTPQASQALRTTITRVHTGAAGEAEAAFLRRSIEAARAAGSDFFSELSRQGSVTLQDGFEIIADDATIEALRQFARRNRLIE